MSGPAPPACPFPALAGTWPGFAGWRIVRHLGTGGMGEVFAGRRDGIEAAVKIIDPARTGAAKARLLAEARAAAAVDHPRLVHCLDLGEEAGHPYLVMELVPGGDGDDLLARGSPVTAAELIAIATDAAEALQALHRAGIIHRDVKPSNLLRGADGRWKLSDFGLARLGDGAPGVTRDGFTVGTPDYMPPEQARGDILDGRADLYALAATLYHLLHGHPPHRAATAWAVIGLVLTEPFPDPLAVRPDLGPHLAAVIRKLGSKDRDRRYDDAQQLLDDLALLRAGREPVLACRRPRTSEHLTDATGADRVLLVEADPLVRDIRAAALRAGGWPVQAVAHAGAALGAVAREMPAAMVVDLVLPDIDGVNMVQRMRRTFPTLPVIALANAFVEGQIAAAAAAGAARVLDKARLGAEGIDDALAAVLARRPERCGPPPDQDTILAVADAALARVQLLMRRLGADEAEDLLLAEAAAAARGLSAAARGLSAAAGVAGATQAAVLAAALEEFARQLLAERDRRTASTRQTMLGAAAALRALLVAPPGTAPAPRVLVVDDEAPGRILACRALEKAGIAHEAVDSSGAALARLRAGGIDLLLTDVVMSGLSGFQLAARVRQLPGCAGLPVIFATGMDDFASFFAAGEGTRTDLIAKPYLVIELAVKAMVLLA